MAKKIKINPFLLILLGYLALTTTGFLGALLVDNFTTYDDFDLGFQDSLWKITTGNQNMVSVSNGELKLSPGVTESNNAIVLESTKLFTTEDISIRYRADFTSGGYTYCVSPFPKIYFGSHQLPMSQLTQYKRTKDCGQSFYREYYKGGALLEIKRYDDLDLSKYVVLLDGVEMTTGTNTEPVPIKLADNIIVDYVKYEPYFSCVVDPDTEVVVRDTFCGDATLCSKGSTINPNTLTYAEKKFCPTDLGVLIVTDQGLTDEKGSITKSIAEGKELQVLEVCPDGSTNCLEAKYVQVDYITKYVTGMKERCGVGQAYDTETQACVQIAQQQIDTPTLLYCEQTSDCIIPQKCNDATVQCVSNQCDYQSAVCTPEQIINEILVIKTIEVPVPEVQFISEGVNQVAFSLDDNKKTQTVAGRTFQTKKPSVLCTLGDNQSGWFTDNGCYQASFTWGGDTYYIKNGQNYKINDYLSVEYKMTGKPARMRLNDEGSDTELVFFDRDWQNTFIVTFNDIFDVQLISIPEKVMLNEGATLTLQIRNRIFDIPGTINYKIKKTLRDVTTTDSNPVTFGTGWKTLSTAIPTNELGGVVGTAYPSFDMIPGEKYIPDEVLLFGTYVSDDPSYVDCRQSGCVNGVCQSDGVCLLETVVIVENKCSSNADCPIGNCDIGSGLCIQTKTVEVPVEVEVELDCNDLGCPADYECQSDGLCTKETVIISECNAQTCPDGTCTNNICKVVIEPDEPDKPDEPTEDKDYTIIWIIGGALFVLLLSGGRRR